MRIRRTTGVFASGCLVYVIMAACSGSESKPFGGTGTTTGGGIGMGGGGGTSMSTSMGGTDSGIMDALMDPVPDADANPTSGSRLKARYLLADDGTKEYQQLLLPTENNSVHTTWWDSQRMEDCAFRLAADAIVRCVPLGYEPNDWAIYLDAACTIRIVSFSPVLGGSSCNFTPPKYVLLKELEKSCPGTPLPTHAYPVGQQVFNPPQNPYVFQGSGPSCSAAGWQLQQPVFKLDPEVDPASLVGATAMVEP